LVVLLDGGGDHDARGVRAQAAAVLREDPDAGLLEAPAGLAEGGAVGETVRAGDALARHGMELGERAHARAGDADEMDRLQLLDYINGPTGKRDSAKGGRPNRR